MYTVVMARVPLTLVLLNLISISVNVVGDALAFFPPEARAMNQFQFVNSHYQPASRNVMPPGYLLPHDHVIPQDQMGPQDLVQPILHRSPVNTLMSDRSSESVNYSDNEAFRMADEDNFRAAKSGYEFPTHTAASYPQTPSYGYSAPSSSYTPPAPAPAAPGYVPPAPAHQPPTTKFSILKPDFTSLIKPVTTKVAGKVSGLIDLVLTLLTGSAPNDLEMKGFKDIVINGIVKPLLIAKGGIKSLISKLTIPLISLLLINLEVLITVWWLWEECPEPVKPTYEYTKPTFTPNNYNSYT